MSTVQVSRTTSTVEVSATRPRVEVGTPSIVAHNDLSGRDAADAHPIGAIAGLLPLPTADGSRYVVSHPGGANPPAWSSQAAWKDQAGTFAQAIRFDGGVTCNADSIGGVFPAGDNPKFAIIGTDAGSAAMANVRFEASSNGPSYYFAKSRTATPGGYGAVQAWDQLGQFRFFGADGASLIRSSQIVAYAEGTISAGVVPGRLGLFTASAAGATTLAAYIDSGQVVVIGQLPASTTTPAAWYGSAFTPALQIVGTTSDNRSIIGQLRFDATGAKAPEHILAHAKSNTVGAYTAIASGDRLGVIAGEGSDGTDLARAGSIRFLCNGTVSANVVPGSIELWTANASGTETLALTVGANQSSAFSGQILATDGSASAPAISFTDDPDTGIYSDSANVIAISIGGTRRLTFAGTLNTQDNYGNYTTLAIRRANGTGAAPTKILSGNDLGLFMFRGAYDNAGVGTFDSGGGPQIRAVASEDFNSAATRGSYLSLSAIPIGSASNVECLRVDGSTVYVYKPLSLSEAANVALGTTTGTKIGTATAQKLGFWNATPVIQPAAAGQAAPAAQGQAALTDSTGGTASTTLAAITAGATYAQADLTAIKNALASLAARLAEVRTDVANIKTFQTAVRTALVNTGLIKGAA